MTSEFDLIGELYLNDDNRHILSEVNSYLRRVDRLDICKSISKSKLHFGCHNCFKVGLQCNFVDVISFHKGLTFCNDCIIEHHDMFSIIQGISIRNYKGRAHLLVDYFHSCSICDSIISIQRKVIQTDICPFYLEKISGLDFESGSFANENITSTKIGIHTQNLFCDIIKTKNIKKLPTSVILFVKDSILRYNNEINKENKD